MKRWHWHVAFWVFYLLFETYVEFAWIGPSFAKLSVSERTWLAFLSELVLMPGKVALVYFLFFLFFPRNEKPKPFWLTVPLAVVGFIVAVVIRRLVLVYISVPYIFQITDEVQPLFSQSLLNSSIIELAFISGISISIKAFRLRARWREREKNLVREKLESELKFLKAQINPHFLFNTLNNIYALARKQSEKTPEAVLKLSQLMRFMLYEARKERILLTEELKMIDDYIDLERIRYNGRLRIDFHKSIDDSTQLIAPLLLIHFVENAFKHGASESRFDAQINLSFVLQRGVLIATIQNTKEEVASVETREKIGLENIKRQLELLYPSHQLEVTNAANEFTVKLTIPLQ